MSDQIIRALAPGVRLVAAITTELVEAARTRHDCSPVATAALGRTMTAALLLSETIKGDECLTIRISGNGPLGDVVADTPLRHGVRGYVRNPQVELPLTEKGKLAVGEAVGEGMLHVTRFSPQREIFTGTVKLISGEIAEDVTRYLLESEQTPSTVGLGVLVDPDGSVAGAAGFLVQAMPDVTEEVLSAIELNLSLVASPSHLAQEGLSASDLIRLLLVGIESATLFEPEPIRFQCTCNREKVGAILTGLGPEELESMVEEGKAEIHCNFCNEAYRFEREELQELQRKGPQATGETE